MYVCIYMCIYIYIYIYIYIHTHMLAGLKGQGGGAWHPLALPGPAAWLPLARERERRGAPLVHAYDSCG